MQAKIIILLLLITMHLYADSDFDRDQIQQRISPVGQVYVQEPVVSGHAAAPPVKLEQPPNTKQNTGQDIFEKYCIVCHKDGLLGAPKLNNTEDWKPRMAKKNIDVLTQTAIKGLNAMPAKGTCQTCSQEDIKAAVEYMVPQK